MTMKDSGLRFGVVTILGHWLGALAFLAFAGGVVLTVVAGQHGLRDFTLATGAVTAAIHGFRLVWRLSNYHPAPLGGANPAQVLVGRGVALGMLLAGVVLPIMFWLDGPGGAARLVPDLHSWWFTTLFWLGLTCFALGFLAHLYGAFVHTFVLKDESLKRLLGFPVEL